LTPIPISQLVNVEWHDNFVRQHETLKCTPAMAVGVEKSLWSLHEVERTSQYGGLLGLYERIADRVYAQTGRRITHTCWIAHVLADHGLTKRIAHNRKSPDRRYPCPPDRRPAIVEALRHLGMIDSN
jgi:hypothetical protein